MLSTPLNERGPDDSDRLHQLEYWCEVIAWLREHYGGDYLAGDLRTRLAMHQAICLLADTPGRLIRLSCRRCRGATGEG